jgi:CrcB protein
MTWLAVAAGGALGAVARHAVNHLVHVRWPTLRVPAATMAVNIGGCFLIGLLAGLLASNRIALRFYWREFVFIGVLGGFTTFSTFGLDTITLVRTGAGTTAIWYAGLQVAVGLAAVLCGLLLGSR